MLQEKEDVRLEKSVNEIWLQTQEILSKKLSQPVLFTWIRPTKLIEITGDEATIAVCNDFARGKVTCHLKAIGSAISHVVNRKITAKIVIDPSLEQDSYTPSIGGITIVPPTPGREQAIQTVSKSAAVGYAGKSATNLNAKYTFESFVIGSHNRFCHSASLAVADRPGQTYNPLFIYGGVGLGKTHIMQAIGHHILSHSPHLQVRYMSCERFTNELINSIRDDRMIEFRKRYRQVDVLLMDDIQFIEGKESTQEEFFHTFNALRESNRQIVLSSDRPPKAFSRLEERLRSRFEWGLIADIQAPDLETRMAILRKKSEVENMRVPDEVLEYIASIFTANIRELEGALIRAHAFASLTGSPLSVNSVASVLQPGGQRRQKPQITMDSIIQTVASYYKVEASELKSANRAHDLALPRHIAMHLAHNVIQLSFPRIADAFNRKHSSVVYADNRIKESILNDADLAAAITQIKHQLSN